MYIGYDNSQVVAVLAFFIEPVVKPKCLVYLHHIIFVFNANFVTMAKKMQTLVIRCALQLAIKSNLKSFCAVFKRHLGQTDESSQGFLSSLFSDFLTSLFLFS